MERREGRELDRIRQEAEAFLREAAWEEYRNLAGLATESRLSAIYDRYAHLADRGLVGALARDPATATSPLTEFLVGHYAGRATAAVTDRLLAAEATATLGLAGETITYRNADVAIRNEADRERRGRLARAKAEVERRLAPLRAEVWARTYDALAELGYGDYVAMCRAFSGVDYDALARRLAAFVAETDDVYRDHLAYFLRRHAPGVPPAERRSHDLARVFRAPEFDRGFPREELLEAAARTAAGLALELTAGGRIEIDAETRPAKRPRAFCMPIEVPGRIVLVVMPQGGQEDYHAFFHELGHALHYAHVAPEAPFEARYLGDHAVTEAFAFLFEHLLQSRPWLRRVLKLSGPLLDDYLRFAHFELLYFIRRYAAKLAYELALHGAAAAAAAPESRTGREMAERYREELRRALAVDYPAEFYLADLDPGFYAARYLRAWMFEAQLRERLVEAFDEDWFRNPRAAPFLAQLWARGQPARLEALAADAGLPAPDLAPLARQLAAALA
ncbi:MAG TPA: hypothetical protein VNM66_04450 [Thermodesulfobacteriota bacterium]|nr:hypothetical protein [Thermodesulfobacteriota bacterium]